MSDTDNLQQSIEAGDAEKTLELIEGANLETLTQLTAKLGQTVTHHVVQHLLSVKPNIVPTILKSLALKGLNIAQPNQDTLLNGKTPIDKVAEAVGTKTIIEDIIMPLLMVNDKGYIMEKMILTGWQPDFKDVIENGDREEVKEKATRLEHLKAKISNAHTAVRQGRLEELKESLEDFNLATAQDNAHIPLLHVAVIFGQSAIAQLIVAKFPDTINSTDVMQRTALHYAACCPDDGQLYQALITAGADQSFKDLALMTPVDYKDNNSQLPMAEMREKILQLTSSASEQTNDRTRPPSSADLAAEGEKPNVIAVEKTEPFEANIEQTPQPPEQNPEPPKSPPKPVTPPGPKVIKPLAMYISGKPESQAPPPITEEGKFMAKHLGTALTQALVEIAEKRPGDPIEYLANWLYKYHANTAYAKKQTEMLKNVRNEEADANVTEVSKFKRQEELLRFQEEEAEKRRLEEAERKRKEQEELQRSLREAALAQMPALPTVTEEEEGEAEAEKDDDPHVKDRDINGMTEMHKLASQNGVDLKALIDLGYSIADRDASGKTMRDIALDANQHENVQAIDEYLKRMLEDGRTDVLERLALDGLEDMEEMSSDSLPEVTKTFMARLIGLKEQIIGAFKATEVSDIAMVRESLESLPKLAQAKDKRGRSLLHVAVLTGNKELVDLLITTSPSMLTCRDNMNRSALHYAYGISEDLANYLVSKEASTKSRDAMKRPVQYYKDNASEITVIRDSLGIPAQTVPTSSLPSTNIEGTAASADTNVTANEQNTSLTADPNNSIPEEAEPSQFIATVATE